MGRKRESGILGRHGRNGDRWLCATKLERVSLAADQNARYRAKLIPLKAQRHSCI
jgi:hypothetical protein